VRIWDINIDPSCLRRRVAKEVRIARDHGKQRVDEIVALTCKRKSNQWIDAGVLFRSNALLQGKLEG
jgi:hypothetical protein